MSIFVIIAGYQCSEEHLTKEKEDIFNIDPFFQIRDEVYISIFPPLPKTDSG